MMANIQGSLRVRKETLRDAEERGVRGERTSPPRNQQLSERAPSFELRAAAVSSCPSPREGGLLPRGFPKQEHTNTLRIA